VATSRLSARMLPAGYCCKDVRGTASGFVQKKLTGNSRVTELLSAPISASANFIACLSCIKIRNFRAELFAVVSC